MYNVGRLEEHGKKSKAPNDIVRQPENKLIGATIQLSRCSSPSLDSVKAMTALLFALPF